MTAIQFIREHLFNTGIHAEKQRYVTRADYHSAKKAYKEWKAQRQFGDEALESEYVRRLTNGKGRVSTLHFM